MIVAELSGGLGNQLFQYAAARRLALMHRAALRLGTRPLRGSARAFALGAFRVKARIAGPASRAWMRVVGAPSFVERSFRFDPDVLLLPGTVRLRGYWQSERYFADV